MFPINYCVNNMISLIASGKWCRQNSKYYWIIPEPDLDTYPDITIQIPIYKEDFHQVILPTICSAILTRSNYKGNCNIVVLDDGYAFQSDSLKDLKMNYYTSLGIAVIARPQNPRVGKFKKASNLNNHICLVRNLSTQPDYTQVISGNYNIGEYIILIDSDSRIDHLAINNLINTIHRHPDVAYVQCHTQPLENSYCNFFARQIARFTKNLYDLVFVLVTISGEPSPLVGHNAVIRTDSLYSAMQEQDKYWSDDKVSEDFDFSFRVLSKGYRGVYVAFATFSEGISFDLHSEVLKMSKFTHGAIEMIFSPVYRQYLTSNKIPWAAKVNISSYLFSYLSLSLSPLVALAFLIASCYVEDLYAITVDPVILTGISFSIFSVLGPISSTLYLNRLQPQSPFGKTTFVQQLTMGIFMFIFYSGTMYWFMLGLTSSQNWGSTRKEHDKVRLFPTYLYHYIFTSTMLIICILFLTIICNNWYGAMPLLFIILMHFIVPILWRGSSPRGQIIEFIV